MESETLAEVPRGKSYGKQLSCTATDPADLMLHPYGFIFLCTTNQQPGNSKVVEVEGQEIKASVIDVYDRE